MVSLLASHLLPLLLSLCAAALAAATNFTYIGFEGSDSAAPEIACSQGASVAGSALQLTATDAIQGMGRCLYSAPIRFLDDAGKPISFSTQFIFSITPSSEDQADGIAFVIAPSLEPASNSSQGYLGLFNSSDANSSAIAIAAAADGQKRNSTAVGFEFDTYKNPEFGDIDGNHIGVDVGSIFSWISVSAAFRTSGSSQLLTAADGYSIQLKGSPIQAWIDFDSASNRVDVSVSRIVGQSRPEYPLISNASLNLSQLLGTHMYVGFTGATGPLLGVGYGVHSWSFSNEGNSSAVVMPASGDATSNSAGLIAGIAAGAGVVSAVLAIVALVFVYRWRRRHGEIALFGTHEQVELRLDRHLPQRYSYRELSRATQGFNPKNLLGSGGFGSVYRGKIASTQAEVAVKRIAQGSKQGPKEFVSEVTTIGQLRHRNLAPLLGWCQGSGGRFLLVYELMPNGSLDQFLFKRSRREELPWPLRLRILKGVAAAVSYLHDECEKRIVHRDIKASNVMLDAQMNARLGDFGLARLYGHDAAQGTTNVAGTWGYMAPESFYTRRATEKTDVFSFGVLALEVVTGRRVSDYVGKGGGGGEEEDCALVEWLWRLHANKTLSKAVDPSLALEAAEEAEGEAEGEEEGEEEERKLGDVDMAVVVLELGLSCCYALPEARPTMRNVLHVLSGEAPPISVPPAVTSPYLFPPREREHSSSYQVSTGLSISSSAFSTESMMRS